MKLKDSAGLARFCMPDRRKTLKSMPRGRGKA